MGKSARGLGILALLSMAALPALAAAQQPAAQPQPQPQPAPTAAPAGTGTGTAAPDKPKGDPGGYTYSDKPAGRATAPAARRVTTKSTTGPVATLPGFEQTADGGSRLFVQLTQNVPVEERKAQGSVTYVLKGAHVHKHNNTNALVTVHFNTPVWRARLVPQGNDLLFVVDLRASATPTFKMQDAADHTAMLTVDFAKGDFSNIDAPAATTTDPAPTKAPAKKAAPKP